MDEFRDPALGLMVARPETLGCDGCEYDDRRCPSVDGIRGYCYSAVRDDGRNIIWIRAASAPQAPKVVRLTDEQINAIVDEHRWDTAAGRLHLARDIERAVLCANNLEMPE